MRNGVLRQGIAAVRGQRARRNLAGMTVEALMVVFAVLVAFAVEEWRTERQLRQFAGVSSSFGDPPAVNPMLLGFTSPCR